MDVRRLPPPRDAATEIAAVGSEPELVDRIREEIATGGPITFARFMERALYEPGLGYYRRPNARPGRQGDFLTAPETHPIFGQALGRFAEDVWIALDRPGTFTLREHGAGEGALAISILDGLAADGSPLLDAIRYQAVEVEAARLAAFAERLADAGHGARIEPTTGFEAAPGAVGRPGAGASTGAVRGAAPGAGAEDVRGAAPGAGVEGASGHATAPITGLILANEVLDALPTHRVRQREHGLEELHVDWNGERFVAVPRPPSTPDLEARLRADGVELSPRQLAEICVATDAWIKSTAAELERGGLLLVDYGHPAAELYGPRRMAGSMLAYVGHRVHDDPLINVGRQDVTAHVDLTAVERAATDAGLDRLGIAMQASFLVGLGIQDLLQRAQADPMTTAESYLALRSGIVRLLDPRATGAFAVLAFGRGIPPESHLRGLG